MSHRIIPTLPRIKATVGHIPQRLKIPNVPTQRARLEVLRQIATRLVREERCELKFNRAEEARPYVERLIQLAVFRGKDDAYAMEMMNWWLLEKDLITKMFQLLVPRFEKMPHDEPYTSIYRLPNMRLPSLSLNGSKKYKQYEIAVLELKGNPFPSIQPLEEERLAQLKKMSLEFVGANDLKNKKIEQIPRKNKVSKEK
uniref:Large ribosomal subunit protein bL17m n=1 Tax=Acrobeloides nanus TaxID=290746 RepID=A0A914D935_9BILA